MAMAELAGSAHALPYLAAPHDNLRAGLPALKADALPCHPVEAIQKQAQVQYALLMIYPVAHFIIFLLGEANLPRRRRRLLVWLRNGSSWGRCTAGRLLLRWTLSARS